MLLRFFKSNHPYVVVILPLVAIILWLPSFLNHSGSVILLPESYYHWPAYGPVISLFKGNIFAMKITALLLVILQAYYIIRLNFRHIFIESKTYLPAILFVMLASALLPFQMLHPALLANAFILIGFDIAFSKEHSSRLIKRYFESGFLIGLGSLFYAPVVITVLIVWFAFSTLIALRWRYVLASIIGVAIPWLFLIAFQFIIIKEIPAFLTLQHFVSHSVPDIQFSWIDLSAMLAIGFIGLLALIRNASDVSKQKVSTRKYFMLFLWLIILTSSSILFFKIVGFEMFIIAAVGLSIHVAMFFKEVRNKWIGELFFTILVLAIMASLWF